MIQPPITLPTLSLSISAPEVKQAISVLNNQLVTAVVVAVLPSNQVQLRLGRQLVLSNQSAVPMKPGDTIQVTIHVSNSDVILKVQPTQQQAIAKNGQPIIQQALSRALPKQAQLTPLLANISYLANQPELKTQPKLSSAIDTIVRQLYQQIIGSDNVKKNDNLKQSLLHSGVMLENLLANANSDKQIKKIIERDFQANLLRLKENLTNEIKQSDKKNISKDVEPQVKTGIIKQETVPQQTHKQKQNSQLQQQVSTQKNTNTTQTSSASPSKLLNTVHTASHSKPISSYQTVETGRTSQPLHQKASGHEQISQPPLRGLIPQAQSRETHTISITDNKFQMMTDLLQQVSASLARIQLSQVASASSDQIAQQNLQVELPVRHDGHIDLFHIDIAPLDEHAQTKNGENTDNGWVMIMAFDLENLGAMQAQVKLSRGHVSTVFYTEMPSTKVMLDNHLHKLGDSLTEHGIEVKKLCCQEGQLPRYKPHTKLSDQVVSVKV